METKSRPMYKMVMRMEWIENPEWMETVDQMCRMRQCVDRLMAVVHKHNDL